MYQRLEMKGADSDERWEAFKSLPDVDPTPKDLKTQAAAQCTRETIRRHQDIRRREQTNVEDCALSARAERAILDKLSVEDRLIKKGWVYVFAALYDLEGNRVRAKLFDGQYGLCWAFCDEEDNFTGKFISAFPKRVSTMTKKGFVEGSEIAPARAKSYSDGSGYYEARADNGYPEDAIVVG